MPLRLLPVSGSFRLGDLNSPKAKNTGRLRLLLVFVEYCHGL